MKTIAFWNRKGGTGKTTTAGNVAGELRYFGRTLVVDCDPQSNMTAWLAPEAQHELADVLSGSMGISKAITPARPGLDILGGFAIGGELRSWIETNIRNKPFAFSDLAETAAAAGYQYMIFDLAPGDGATEIYALSACDSVILVANAEAFSYDGIEAAEFTLGEVKANLRARFEVSALVANRVNRSYLAHHAYLHAINQSPYPVYSIGQSTAIHDAQPAHKTLNEYEPGNAWTSEYLRIAEALK